MSDLMGPLPKTDPVILAWQHYTTTAAFCNTRKWARDAEHTEGSLWAAFLEGSKFAQERIAALESALAAERDARLAAERERDALREALGDYGVHDVQCASMYGDPFDAGLLRAPCDCGLQAALGGRAAASPAGGAGGESEGGA